MTHTATLIVDPATPLLADDHLRRAAAVLSTSDAPVWLAPGIAADLSFAPAEGFDNRRQAEALRAALAPDPIDVVIQATAGRRKALLVADMDSTLIAQECIDELADAVGLREHIAAITERSMRGEIEFEPALRERVGLLRGLALTTALNVFRSRVTYTPGGRTLALTMRANGATTAIASGGFTLFTALVVEALGFDTHFANTLVVVQGKLTGALEEPILGRDEKREVLRGLRNAHGLAASKTMAVGDGANDLSMLADAGLGVAYHAKAAVAAAAHARIDHADLTALLYAQGYRQTEFVT